ncbi:hypothetical protein Ciccas_002869 [Cichlidogyrus casuarinus]|uniref:K Homology domain-containing protein n=1 Tax=Cichlidogyrus casuarinus TaxID=1844966 RepID=A0ABD2QG10_9PLAT
MSVENPPPLDVRMLVHSSQAGCVIGKSGAKIRELRENSGLKTLKMYQMLCPSSTDRVIQLVGDLDKIIGCVTSINELLGESPIRGARHSFDTRHSNEAIAIEYGGWANPSVPVNNRPYANPAYGPGFVSGNRGGMFNDMGRMGPGNGPGGDATAAAMMAAGMMRGAPPRMSMAMTSTTQVSVSDKMIGAIMGRAGSRINQVRQESGADIKISNQDPNSEDRIITITGTPDQIQNAQFLLQVCVRKYGEAHM